MGARTVKVTLGDKSFTVKELPSKKNEKWRQQLNDLLKEVGDLLEGAPQTELTDMAAVKTLLDGAGGLLLGSIGKVRALLQSYSPKQFTNPVLDASFDSEIVEAFGEVVRLAFPFGALSKGLKNFLRG